MSGFDTIREIAAKVDEAEKKEFEDFLKAGKFDQARQMLLKRITANVLDWKTVNLDGGHTVQVCLPVRVKGPDGKMYYVPVKPSETWTLARRFHALPLTSAVFDQYHNQATYVALSPKHNAGNSSGTHFHTFSDYLNDNNYHTGKRSGAHKLWILSARGKAVNHGFYSPKPKDPAKYLESCKPLPKGSCTKPGGAKLDPSYWLWQNRGAAHNSEHWDYSQLLQLMRSDDLFAVQMDIQNSSLSLPFISVKVPVPAIKLVGLREAVLEGLPEVWDEPTKIKAEILP
jgi:hypothetical protein